MMQARALNYAAALAAAERLNAELREIGAYVDARVEVEDGPMLAWLQLWISPDDDEPIARMPVEHATAHGLDLMVRCYQLGERHGKASGRRALQYELRALLNVDRAQEAA